MKKSLVAALTGMFVVGATATTFAAANPFSDVPAGHWAYNSVTKLANEGVIEGYGDGTYRGNRNITRYEMAQMVARALAKTPTTTISAASRAELDKLAAEFRDELDNLGVRVDELEKHADKVKWTGKIEYTYSHFRAKNNVNGDKDTSIGNGGVFRLEPTAEVNSHWKAIARLDAGFNMRDDSTGYTESDGTRSGVKLKRVYAQGDYGKFGVKLGRFGFCPPVEDGMVVDTVISGGELSFGSKWKFTVTAGRVGANSDEAHYYGGNTDRATNTAIRSIIGDSLYYNAGDLNGRAATSIDPATGLATSDDFVPAADRYVGEVTANYDAAGNIISYTPTYYTRDIEDGATNAALGKYGKAFDTYYRPAYDAAYATTYANQIAAGASVAAAEAAAYDAGVAAGTTAVRNNAAAIAAYTGNTHPTDIVGINISYDQGETGLYGLASWYHAKDKDFQNYFYSNNGDTDKANVWALNLGYRFTDNLKLWGGYAQNTKADNEKSAWQAEVRYGNYGDYAEKGDWAVWAGYAKFGYNAALASNQSDDVQTGTKGWHIGAAYAPFKNVGLLVRYSDGKYISSGDKYRKIFARGEWFF